MAKRIHAENMGFQIGDEDFSIAHSHAHVYLFRLYAFPFRCSISVIPSKQNLIKVSGINMTIFRLHQEAYTTCQPRLSLDLPMLFLCVYIT